MLFKATKIAFIGSIEWESHDKTPYNHKKKQVYKILLTRNFDSRMTIKTYPTQTHKLILIDRAPVTCHVIIVEYVMLSVPHPPAPVHSE